MHINTEEKKNIKNDLSLKSTNASFPMICEKVEGPVAVGGVLGRKNDSIPKITADTMDI